MEEEQEGGKESKTVETNSKERGNKTTIKDRQKGEKGIKKRRGYEEKEKEKVAFVTLLFKCCS